MTIHTPGQLVEPIDLQSAFQVFQPVWQRFLGYVRANAKMSQSPPTLDELRILMVAAFESVEAARRPTPAPAARATAHDQVTRPTTPGPLDHLPDVLTVSEVAEVLRVSGSVVYEAIRRKEIPHLRIGRRLMVPRRELEQYLAEARA
jgi:excisionase family DNA binding protein